MKALIKFFWIFMIGSFLGSFVEEVWCFIRNKCFKIRKSLVHMPLIPIYGIAACLIVKFGYYVNYDEVKIFVLGVLIATIVEYVSSYLQEKIFKTKSWDYKDMPFNINGRVNLLYSIGFGFVAVLFTNVLCDVGTFIDGIRNDSFLYFITLIFLSYFVYDVIMTILATRRQKDRREGIVATKDFDIYLDIKYSDERLNKIYNNSVYIGE